MAQQRWGWRAAEVVVAAAVVGWSIINYLVGAVVVEEGILGG